jgi:type IV pilus assembly protein PilC
MSRLQGFSLLVAAQQRAVFFRCLATLFESGVPLVHSYELLSRQTEHPGLAEAAADVSRQLSRGVQLSRAMQRHPWCFSPLHLALIRVGENSGALGQIFLRLAREEEAAFQLQQRLRSSLMMPLIITATCLVLVTLVAPLVLGSVLKSMELKPEQMPWATQVLIVGSGVLTHPVTWILGLVALAGFFSALRAHGGSPDFRRWLAYRLDRVPGLGPLLRMFAVAQFVRTLEMTLAVGFPLIQALRMAGEAGANPQLQDHLLRSIESVTQGDELHQALEQADYFPPMVIQTVRAGQEAGSLVKLLANIVKILQLQLDHATETFTTALEPVVIGVVGALVGFCVIATMLPMVKLVDSL